MIQQDLDQLSVYIERLAALTRALRAERNDLQGQIAKQAAEIERLQHTISLAHERVDYILNQLPGASAALKGDLDGTP